MKPGSASSIPARHSQRVDVLEMVPSPFQFVTRFCCKTRLALPTAGGGVELTGGCAQLYVGIEELTVVLPGDAGSPGQG